MACVTRSLALVVASLIVVALAAPVWAPVPVMAADGQGVKVHLNKASQQELEAVRWIGPVLSQRIVEYRDSNGPFKSVEELIQVPGIGEVKFQKIKDQVTL